MDYLYIQEKLSMAVYELAIGKGDICSRLLDAFHELVTLTPENFPPELQEDWNWIYKNLTKKEPTRNSKGEVIFGSVQNTLSHIRNSTGSKIASRILDLYYRLDNYNNAIN